jgi:dTDP-4-amino-4,6-dideoxygalactose transaminase
MTQGNIGHDGPFTRKCEAFLEDELGVCRAFLTTSCTHALEMSALLLDLQPGDEVIVPSFTFVSTGNAFVLRGAKPVFIDIRPDTLNLDATMLERLITPRTRAIIPVHYAGVGCDMDAILEIAARKGLAIVEDNAHGLFAKYRGKHLGTFGALAALSFGAAKNLTCGQGGALLINDPRYVERAEIIRERGTNRSRFLRGELDEYTWVDLGSHYAPSEILAAILYAEFEARAQIQAKRQRAWKYYEEHLQEWARENDVRLAVVPKHCEQPYHIFYLLLPSRGQRRALIDRLEAHGILGVSHYVPLHLSPMGRRLGGKPGDCPVTEHVSACLLRLPLYTELTEQDQARVVAAIKRERTGPERIGLRQSGEEQRD